MKKRLADRLQRWAHRLDPNRPMVVTDPVNGGWKVTLGGMDLATINAGMIGDRRHGGGRQ